MQSVAVLDQVQLQRLDDSIRLFAELSRSERARKMYLLNALQRERNELIDFHRSPFRPKSCDTAPLVLDDVGRGLHRPLLLID